MPFGALALGLGFSRNATYGAGGTDPDPTLDTGLTVPTLVFAEGTNPEDIPPSIEAVYEGGTEATDFARHQYASSLSNLLAGTFLSNVKVAITDPMDVGLASIVATGTAHRQRLERGTTCGNWSDILIAGDSVPDAFTFTDKTGQAVSSVIASAAITLDGLTAETTVSITGGTATNKQWRKNGGSWGSADGYASDGDTIEVRGDSSASYETETTVTLNVGGVEDTFSITTMEDPAAATVLDSAAKHSSFALSGGDLTGTGTDWNALHGARATNPKTTGKWYAEFRIDTLIGEVLVGVVNSTHDFTGFTGRPGDDSNGIAWDGSNVFSAGSYTSPGSGVSATDIMQIMADVDNKKLYVGVNNSWKNGDPAAGTGGTTHNFGASWYPFVKVKRNDVVTARFAAGSQTYSAPTGSTAWDG